MEIREKVYEVVEDQTISKKLFYTEDFENTSAEYSIGAVSLIKGERYLIKNFFISKYRDESYKIRVNSLNLMALPFQIIGVDNGPAFGGPFPNEYNFPNKAILRNFNNDNVDTDNASATQYAADYSVENKVISGVGINEKEALDTYVEISIYSGNAKSLHSIFSGAIVYPITIDGQILNTDQDLFDFISIRPSLVDHDPDFYIELRAGETDLSRFKGLQKVASFSTIDIGQSDIVLNYQAQDEFLIFVPRVKSKKSSSSLINTDPVEFGVGGSLAVVQQVLDDIKNDLSVQIASDTILANNFKIANIEAIFNFNLRRLKEISDES